jgi:hypothetical protein
MDRAVAARARLRTPKAAAVAGMLFAALFITAFLLLRLSVPSDPAEPGAWLHSNARTVAVALNIIPFSGIAFLWFIAVLRDRMGQMGDSFFATVFFGSGLLFLACLFTAAAVIGAILATFGAKPDQVIDSPLFYFARAAAYSLINIYMIKMASVFMITTSTIALYSNFLPRWFSLTGYAIALVLLFGSFYLRFGFLLFPAWVFGCSLLILRDDKKFTRDAGSQD